MATEFGEAMSQAAWWPCLWQLRLAADWHVELWIFGSGTGSSTSTSSGPCPRQSSRRRGTAL